MLIRSLSTARRHRAYNRAFCKRYCSLNSNGKNEYEVKFYSRPFGLDLKYNEFNDHIFVERSAWKDIKIPSILCKINGETLHECLATANDTPEDQEPDEDTHKFKSTIKHLQTCRLPATITFQSSMANCNTFTSSIAPLLELPPAKSFYEMTVNEVVDYLHTNWLKQTQIYHKFQTNPVFRHKYSSFVSLMDILVPNLGNFNATAERLRQVPELTGKDLSNHTLNHNVICGHIQRMALAHNTIKQPSISWNDRLKGEMMAVLQLLDEKNIERIDSKTLFQNIIGELLFDALINITEKTRISINTAYLCTHKHRILDTLCQIVSENKKSFRQQNTFVNATIKRYFNGAYDFMEGDTAADSDLRSEYWFIVTLLNDFLSFPINHSTECCMETKRIPYEELTKKPSPYQYILRVEDVEVLAHSQSQINQNAKQKGEILIQYIGKSGQSIQYSLRDRLEYFKCDALSLEPLKKYLMRVSDVKEQQIEGFLGALPSINNVTRAQVEQMSVVDIDTDGTDPDDECINIDAYMDQLSVWIYNIVEVLRSADNKEEDLFSYLTSQRPKELIQNDVHKITKMSRNQLTEFVANKVSQIVSDEENESEVATLLRKTSTQDALLRSLNQLEMESKELTDLSMQELCDKGMETNCFDDASEAKQMMVWLYSLMHDVHRVETPIFDQMMQRRKALKKSLLTATATDGEDEFMEFKDLKESVDHKLYSEDHPQWHQYSDELEKQFVTEFLHNTKGFAQHAAADKFESMSCLAKLTNRQLRKMELCARDRKNLMKKVNKWSELQNIVKYGERPYYRSNGYERTSIPSSNQCYGEIGANKSRDFDPKTDQTKATKMFYVPFVSYADLHKLVQNRRFDPAKHFNIK